MCVIKTDQLHINYDVCKQFHWVSFIRVYFSAKLKMNAGVLEIRSVKLFSNLSRYDRQTRSVIVSLS